MNYDVVIATERSVRQLAGSETFAQLGALVGAREAAAELMEISATTYCQNMSRGQERQFLSDWHRYMQSLCSEQYSELVHLDGTQTRAEINNQPELALLNGIRSGVRRALVQGHHQQDKLKRPQTKPESAVY